MKRVLWIVNITLPDACKAVGLPVSYLGGWLTGYAEALLANYPTIELHIVEPYSGGTAKTIQLPFQSSTTTSQSVTHHLFPASWIESSHSFATKQGSRLSPLSNQLPTYFMELQEEVKPDVVHIHGSEMAHSLSWVEACTNAHTIVSIQGLTSVYARYYMGGLTEEELKGCWSFNDWRFHRTLPQEQRQLAERGAIEQELLKRVDHVAGRTSWDKAQTWAINPDIQYHQLQEVLRAPFYQEENKWNLANCQRHRIFVSQSHYPIKGLHRLLQALPLIIRQYPDTQLYIVGEDRIDQHWRHRSTYVNVLRKLIYQHGLRDRVHYLGSLSAEQMIEQFQQAHLYVCPSAIENSCNSLCEAQLLGTPVVASYVGGLMDLVEHGRTGLLYRFEEVEMLAHEVCQIFADDQFAQTLSQESRQAALSRHDRKNIAHTLYNIYSWI